MYRKDAEDIELLSKLYITRASYPESKALPAIEALLFESVSISEEGLFNCISQRYKTFVDNTVIKLNKMSGIFNRLTHEELKTLEKIKRGEVASKDVTLPVSSGAVTKSIKFISAVISWFALQSFTGFLTTEYRQQRLKDDKDYAPRKKLQDEIYQCEDMLRQKGERVENDKACVNRSRMYKAMSKCIHAVTDSLRNIDWDAIQKRVNTLREKEANCTSMTTATYKSRRAFRTITLGTVVVIWLALSVWIIKQIVGLIKRILNKLKGSTHQSSGEEDTDFDSDY